MSDTIKLPDEKVELLYRSNQLDSPVVLEEETVETVKKILAEPLADRGLSDISEMRLEYLAAQYSAAGPADADALDQQMPETGRATPSYIAEDGFDVDAFTAADAPALRSTIKRRDLFEERDVSLEWKRWKKRLKRSPAVSSTK